LEKLHIAEGQAFKVLASRIPSWSGWLASIVVDESGNHVGTDGNSKSISNELDLQLLLALRSKCSVIVTTGATARAEAYRSSRFAPIAFLTKNRSSLIDVPAVKSPGTHQNIFLDSYQTALDFGKIGSDLQDLGHKSLLFEGGPSVLEQLLSSGVSVQLVLSVVGSETPGETFLNEANPRNFLNRDLTSEYQLELADDFSVGRNRVTRWLKQAS